MTITLPAMILQPGRIYPARRNHSATGSERVKGRGKMLKRRVRLSTSGFERRGAANDRGGGKSNLSVGMAGGYY